MKSSGSDADTLSSPIIAYKLIKTAELTIAETMLVHCTQDQWAPHNILIIIYLIGGAAVWVDRIQYRSNYYTGPVSFSLVGYTLAMQYSCKGQKNNFQIKQEGFLF